MGNMDPTTRVTDQYRITDFRRPEGTISRTETQSLDPNNPSYSFNYEVGTSTTRFPDGGMTVYNRDGTASLVPAPSLRRSSVYEDSGVGGQLDIVSQ